MKRAPRRVLWLILLLVAKSVRGQEPQGVGHMASRVDAIAAFSQLKTTLSKLYPIEHWTMSTTLDGTYPFAPRFCWQFFRADPETLRRLGEAIRSYPGDISWIIGPPLAKERCLIATMAGNSFVGYPPISLGAILTKENEVAQSPPTEEFVNQALADVPKLCSHLEGYLKLEGRSEKSFDYRLAVPADPPSLQSDPTDFVEPGMHVAWIVRTGVGHRETKRRMLHFSVTEDEWRRIHADILHGTSSAREGEAGYDARFPLLSRIEETESICFAGAEVEALETECLRARARSSESLVIRGLDKLILLCHWAQHEASDLLLRAP